MVLKTARGWRAQGKDGAPVGPRFRARRLAVAFQKGLVGEPNRYQDDAPAAEAYRLGRLLRGCDK